MSCCDHPVAPTSPRENATSRLRCGLTPRRARVPPITLTARRRRIRLIERAFDRARARDDVSIDASNDLSVDVSIDEKLSIDVEIVNNFLMPLSLDLCKTFIKSLNKGS